jgi:hypothetical protein
MKQKCKKYSVKWKHQQGKWIQDHIDSYGHKVWKIHYIRNNTEYSTGRFWNRKEASDALKAL